jgi:hypothetical protein
MKFNFKTSNYKSPVTQQGNPLIRTSVPSFLFEDVISEIYVALDELTEYCTTFYWELTIYLPMLHSVGNHQTQTTYQKKQLLKNFKE